MQNEPFISSAENSLDLFKKLNFATGEIARLKAALAVAEMNSAARLGVPPVDIYQANASVSGDVAAIYAGMMAGPEKSAFYRKNAARIWAKAEANAAAE
jgi:hypothetical protein